MKAPDSAEVSPTRVERDFHPTRWNRLGSVGFSVGLGGFSAFAASVLLGRGELLGLGFLGVAAWAGWAAIRWLQKWRRGGAAISLTEDGILDRTALGAPTFISWTEIDSVHGHKVATTVRLRGNTGLRIPLHRRFLNWITRRPKNEYLLPTRLLETHHYAVESFISEWHESLLLDSVKTERDRLPTRSESEAAEGTEQLPA